MKKIGFACTLFALLLVGSTGCDSKKTTVIEAPPVEANSSSGDGMSEEDYNKAMEKSMNDRGN